MKMKTYISITTAALALVILASASRGFAFGAGDAKAGCQANCSGCHSLSKEEAAGILRATNPKIVVDGVQPAPAKGLWEISIRIDNEKGVVYIDYAKENIILGNIIGIKSGKNVTGEKIDEMNKVDVSKINVKNALLLGGIAARHKLFVFDDPD
jgi:thiol:disulfide interchange protein DsbC